MEWAFRGPWALRERLGGPSTRPPSWRMDPADSRAVPRQAGHPPVSEIDGQAHARDVAVHLIEHHHGDAEAIWNDGVDA